jgi:hypothetical protein
MWKMALVRRVERWWIKSANVKQQTERGNRFDQWRSEMNVLGHWKMS